MAVCVCGCGCDVAWIIAFGCVCMHWNEMRGVISAGAGGSIGIELDGCTMAVSNVPVSGYHVTVHGCGSMCKRQSCEIRTGLLVSEQDCRLWLAAELHLSHEVEDY